MKTISIVFVCSVLIACDTVDPDQELSQRDEAPELGITESAILQCGIGCGADYHVAAYYCSLSCGSCPGPKNQTDCQPNTGSNFLTCGIGCPNGYHPSNYDYNSACDPIGGSTAKNHTACSSNTGSAFWTCGLECPAPYQPSFFAYYQGCNISSGSAGNNFTFCRL